MRHLPVRLPATVTHLQRRQGVASVSCRVTMPEKRKTPLVPDPKVIGILWRWCEKKFVATRPIGRGCGVAFGELRVECGTRRGPKNEAATPAFTNVAAVPSASSKSRKRGGRGRKPVPRRGALLVALLAPPSSSPSASSGAVIDSEVEP